MNRELLDVMQQYGFSEKEAKIYLTGISLGSAPASTIARHVGANRVTVYSILKNFVQDGIFTVIDKSGTQYFSAMAPDILARQMEDQYKKFIDRVPELMALVNAGVNKPKVQFFEGVIGLKTLFDDFSTSTINMRAILGTPYYKDQNNILLKASAEYRKIRKEKGLISERIITGQSTTTDKEYDEDNHYGRKTVFVDKDVFSINADINIYGPGKVSFLFFNKKIPHAIMVESMPMYITLNSIFEYMWCQHVEKN